MDSSDEKKLKALIRLLSDPNERVAATIQDQLIQFGESALPYLAKLEHHDPVLNSRVAQIQEEIYFTEVKKDFQNCCTGNGNTVDLESGAFLIAQTVYPTLNVPYYRQFLEDLAQEFRSRLMPTDSLKPQIQSFNRFLFEEKGFRGNRTDYYDPENSFMNRVIDRRMGIPISLSVLYVLLGQRLGFPVEGVGMPGHFIVKLGIPSPYLFVDCFNGGILLRESDCKKFLTESGFGFEPHFLEPSPNHMILERMLRNLLGIYQQQKEHKRMERVDTLIAILRSNVQG